jgi:AcrR family transcriptional regulator
MKAAQAPKKDGYHHGDLRNALLETALRLVSARGPEGFSLREAAREVGVSPGAAYRHFADKAALLTALAVDGHVRLADAMEREISRVRGAAGSKARAVARFVALGAAYVDFGLAHPAHFQVMFGPCMDAEVKPCSPLTGRGPFDILVDALDGLVAAGAVSAAGRAGAEITVWSAVHGLATLQVDGALTLSPPERAQAMAGTARLLLAGMGCPGDLLPDGPALDADPRPPERRRKRTS